VRPAPADQGNGLDGPSRIMVDEVTTVRRSKLGTRVGVLDDASVLRLNRALVVFLGIASSVSGG
jgi:mRNA interferase MazF